MNTFISDISGHEFPADEKVHGESIRWAIMQLIHQEHPDFDNSKKMSIGELNTYRERDISEYLNQEIGELTELEQKVLATMKKRSMVSCLNQSHREPKPSIGVKISDRIARFGGSWSFVILFGSIMVVWMVVNIFWLSNMAVDPYPFVLLNLMLTYISTLQAPIIMMSQNRQTAKDRQRSKEDYAINLKSEIEVRTLHEKLDHLMIRQQQHLVEIQQIQIDILTDIQKQVANHQASIEEIEKEN
jgi:uncharacterized membrane protein